MKKRKTLLLTGGSQGIGRATVEFFLRQGWRVVFVARSEPGIRQCLEDLAAAGFGDDSVRGLRLDVSDLDAVEAFPATCPFLEEGLDALVLNAFYQKIKPAQEFTRDELDMHWKVNNLSPMLLINACFEQLRKTRGSIVYVSSIMDERLASGYAAYGATKACMRAYVRQAAMDFGPQGVRINSISPGCVQTEALKTASEVNGAEGRAESERILRSIPLDNRFGEPVEIAEAIWFAITGPRYFHGRDLRIDGGFF